MIDFKSFTSMINGLHNAVDSAVHILRPKELSKKSEYDIIYIILHFGS